MIFANCISVNSGISLHNTHTHLITSHIIEISMRGNKVIRFEDVQSFPLDDYQEEELRGLTVFVGLVVRRLAVIGMTCLRPMASCTPFTHISI